jgi:hypothetical protein
LVELVFRSSVELLRLRLQELLFLLKKKRVNSFVSLAPTRTLFLGVTRNDENYQ